MAKNEKHLVTGRFSPKGEAAIVAMSGYPLPAGWRGHRGRTNPANLLGILLDYILFPGETASAEDVQSLLEVGRRAWREAPEGDYSDVDQPMGPDGFFWRRQRGESVRWSKSYPTAGAAKNAARSSCREGDLFGLYEVRGGQPISLKAIGESPLDQRIDWRGGEA